MYIPEAFHEDDLEKLLEFMRAHSFATLVSVLDGSPFASHVPLVIRRDGDRLILTGHLAKANSQWKAFGSGESLAIFSGPHAYVSPTLYEKRESVPTWNYIAIHAYGTLEIIEGEAEKESLLSRLIEANEPAYAAQWRELPESFRRTLLAGIVGFRIPIRRIEGKFKLSQNRHETDRRNIHAAHAAGTDDQQSLASWMKRLTEC